VVEEPHFDQCQCLLDASCDGAVGGRGFGVARRVIVEGDDGGGVEQERPLYDFARVNFRAVDGAEEEVFDSQDGVPRVEEDAAEDFAVAVSTVGSEEHGCAGRFGELALALQLAAEDAFGGFEDLFVSVALGQPHVVSIHGVVSRGGVPRGAGPARRPHGFAPMSEHATARAVGAATEAA
jgi:hypothetical protein